MNTMARLWRRLRAVFLGSRFDRELEEEMRQHLEWRIQDGLDAGLDPAEARRMAAKRFGGTLQVREASRDAWGLTWLTDFVQDLRFGARLLGRNPGFTTVAILSLGLGIGGNTAIFSVLDAVVYRTLPVRAADELVLFGQRASLGYGYGRQGGERSLFSYGEYAALRDRAPGFAGTYAVSEAPGEMSIGIDSAPAGAERATGSFVSGSYFPVLGVTARVGRVLGAADDGAPGAAPVAVISDRYWAARFWRDPNVLGRRVHVGRTALVIVGVAAEGFAGDHVGKRPDLWIPLAMQPDVLPNRGWLDNPLALWLRIVGRVPHGTAVSTVNAGLNVTLQQVLRERAGSNLSDADRKKLAEQRITLTSAARGVSGLRRDFEASLLAVMGMVALVLLIACTNLATLMLARATAREKELGMRLALGAGRARVVRQMLAESLLLSVLGALAGLGLARVGGSFLLQVGSTDRAPIPLELPMDARLLAFTAGVTLLTALVIGVVPAWRVSRSDPMAAVRTGPAHAASAGYRLSGRKSLVALQVAVTLVLLVASGLLVATERNLAKADLGFDATVVQLEVDAVPAGYSGQRATDLAFALAERLGRVPGVVTVSLADNGILSGSQSVVPVNVVGDKVRPEDDRYTNFDLVSNGFFRTLRVPLVEGREFDERDNRGGPPVAIINESMARFYFGGATALGHEFSNPSVADGRPITIVGVVRDVRDIGPRDEASRRFYLPYAQDSGGLKSIRLQLRLSGTSEAVAPAVRAAIREMDPLLDVSPIVTLETVYSQMMARDRLMAGLASSFGGLAVFLAATGLYGVLAYAVARRTKEIGIRVALGARRGTVARMVLRDGGLMVAAGAAVGVPAAYLAARAMAGLLVGLSSFEPAVFGAAIALLVLVAALAAYLPARHAARVDPLTALRLE